MSDIRTIGCTDELTNLRAAAIAFGRADIIYARAAMHGTALEADNAERHWLNTRDALDDLCRQAYLASTWGDGPRECEPQVRAMRTERRHSIRTPTQGGLAVTLFDATPYGPETARAPRQVEHEPMVKVRGEWRLMHAVRSRPTAHLVSAPALATPGKRHEVMARCGKVAGLITVDGEPLAPACPKCLALEPNAQESRPA